MGALLLIGLAIGALVFTGGGSSAPADAPKPTPTPREPTSVPGLRVEQNDGGGDTLIITDARALLAWAKSQIEGDPKLPGVVIPGNQTASTTATWLLKQIPRDDARRVDGIVLAQYPPPNDDEWHDVLRRLDKLSTEETLAMASKGLDAKGM